MISAEHSVRLVCDLQVKFAPAIHHFTHVVATARKMLKLAKILEIPVLATEQNPAKLGPTVSDIGLQDLGPLHVGTFGKTLFSMITSEVADALQHTNAKHVVLLGIESHICILQTALDLLSRGYSVYVLADGVSSVNKEETPIALAAIRQAGAVVTTSDSIAYQLLRDANHLAFRSFTMLAKEEKESTKTALTMLLGNGTAAS